MERFILPKIPTIITVSDALADLYKKEYKKPNLFVVRNLPFQRPNNTGAEASENILLYQGVINVNRGIETMVKAMQHLNNTALHLIGTGDVEEKIKALIKQLKLEHKVKLLGHIPFQKLSVYTEKATLGLSLEEDKGLNYRFSLPNKVFDYIQSGVPILVSDLPEMRKIVAKHEVGESIAVKSPKQLAERIEKMISDKDKLKKYKANARKAAAKLCWEEESKLIQRILNK